VRTPRLESRARTRQLTRGRPPLLALSPESLRDLLYSLRQDEEETRPTFMLLGQWNIVQSDLLPILQAYHTDHDLVIAASTPNPHASQLQRVQWMSQHVVQRMLPSFPVQPRVVHSG
jgi:hypothetical protein